MHPEPHDPSRAPIELQLRPSRFPAFAAVLHLRGEHDMATAPAITEALESVFGDLVVDLTECSFCDSSVVQALFEAGASRLRDGRRLELLVPPSSTAVARILEITGLPAHVPTHADIDGIDNAESVTAPAGSMRP
jgi:anti-anti-sigma factor